VRDIELSREMWRDLSRDRYDVILYLLTSRRVRDHRDSTGQGTGQATSYTS